jgi:hypothetical protein
MKWVNKHMAAYPYFWSGFSFRQANLVSIHNDTGTGYDGTITGRIGWSLFIGSVETHSIEQRPCPFEDTIPKDFFPTGVNLKWGGVLKYGRPNFCTRLPKIIRLLYDYGWYSNEMVPLTCLDEGFESIYLPHVSVNKPEQFIDYANDLKNPLNTYAIANNIAVFATSINPVSGQNISTIAPDPSYELQNLTMTTDNGPASFSIYQPLDTSSRWLFNVIPRYAVYGIDSNYGIQNWSGPHKKHQQELFIPKEKIVGGDVLTIIFVTDGYGAYHGVSTSTFVSPESVAYRDKSKVSNPNMLADDLQRVTDCAPRFNKYGLLIVNSPKNPIGYPCWAGGNLSNQCRQYAFYDAQQHFNYVKSQLTGSGISCKVLSRNIEITDPVASYEIKSLKFANDPVPISDIMSQVTNFFATGEFT